MNGRKVVVVSAGIGVPSSTRLLADRLAAATREALRARSVDAEIEVIELRELAHEITDNLLTGFPSGRLRAAIEAVTGADGLIAVTPVFSASYSGLFKSFFDVLERHALTGMPVLIAATGGTERHSLVLEHAMRPLFAYLRTIVVPTAVYAAPSDLRSLGDGSRALIERVDLAGGELAALIAQRSPAERPGQFDGPVPFEDLLSGG
ncbi:FMN reductase [Thermopolyspora sp. NPDC052614]|uniref:FMN reductase n=1 Tax=Thermopolyspora sp. NPDC052614 TaxID=3155682 RepID=UPI00341E59C1